MTPFHIIIPARFESTRLPRKLLKDIAGKPMLQHVYERAMASGALSVVIATDHEAIQRAAESFGATVCLTCPTHSSGTERIAEAVDSLEYNDDDILVNVQGDEPAIPPSLITQVAENLSTASKASMATLCEPIALVNDLADPNQVKVVFNKERQALYFSRSPIPWIKSEQAFSEGLHYRHIGLYAYRVGFIRKYVRWTPSPLEKLESLEQLRVLWHGHAIHIDIACENSMPGVDTEADLATIRSFLENNPST